MTQGKLYPNYPMSQPLVLLVDNEMRYREMLFEAVRQMGYEAKAVGTGEAALRILAGGQYGIVVMDLNLPGMDGVDLMEAIRRDYPPVQMVILTGSGDLTAAKRAMRCDVVDFITKPCQLDELELSLSRAWGRRRRAVSGVPLERSEPESEPAAPLEVVERAHILAAMKRHSGNRRAVATELGISLRTLYNRLRDYKQNKLMA